MAGLEKIFTYPQASLVVLLPAQAHLQNICDTHVCFSIS